MKLKAVVAALTAICVAEVIAGGILTLRYLGDGAYGAMAVQFAEFLVSLIGAAYGGYWLKDNRRKRDAE